MSSDRNMVMQKEGGAEEEEQGWGKEGTSRVGGAG